MKKTDWTFHAKKVASGIFPVLLASPVGAVGEMSPAVSDRTGVHAAPPQHPHASYRHLRPDDRLGDLLNHPAFHGFGHRLLPWDGRNYDPAMTLRNMSELLPYHSHVVPDVVVAALNRMVDDAGAGRAVFYEFYTDARQQAKSGLEHTGLFFFRGKPGAAFAVIAPGGGFAYVGSVHEGFPYAEAISRHGFNAFVLKYRAGQGGQTATEDLAAAIAWIFKNAETLQVGTAGYSLWGSSAGARMAAAIGSHGPSRFGAASLPKPAVVVMAYTGHSEIAKSEPATFVVVGERDGISPPAVMEARIARLRRIGTRVEYRKYPRVGHGFGTGQGTSAHGWIDQAVGFWNSEIETTP